MDLSYFLEMVDRKHRYGSNLRKYHAEWKQRPTSENFFFWLDEGEGKNVEVEKCSRERLEKMQIRYLGREERRLYEVVVDEQGKLCWRKDGLRVDTSDAFRDSVEGIVPVDDPAPTWTERPAILRGSDESSGMSSEGEDATAGANEGEKVLEVKPSNQSISPTEDKPKQRTSFHEILRRPTEKDGTKKKKKRKKKQKWIFVSTAAL